MTTEDQPLQIAEKSSSPAPGSVIGGVALMVGWALVHYALFYLFVVSGVLVDLMLAVVKSIMFPGAAQHQPSGAHEMFGWAGVLQVGLCLAGAAGVPAGLARFWNSQRTTLRWTFWFLLIGGIGCEIAAVIILLRNAFTLPS